MSDVRNLGLHERCKIIAGVGPVRSPRALEHMRTNVPGIVIPRPSPTGCWPSSRRSSPTRACGCCAETIERVREIPGVAGVHVMAFGNESAVPEILQLAGFHQVAGTDKSPKGATDNVG